MEMVEFFAKQATVSQSNFLFLSRLVMVLRFEFHLSEIPSKIDRDEVTRLASGGARFSNLEILYTLGHRFCPRKEKRGSAASRIFKGSPRIMQIAVSRHAHFDQKVAKTRTAP